MDEYQFRVLKHRSEEIKELKPSNVKTVCNGPASLEKDSNTVGGRRFANGNIRTQLFVFTQC